MFISLSVKKKNFSASSTLPFNRIKSGSNVYSAMVGFPPQTYGATISDIAHCIATACVLPCNHRSSGFHRNVLQRREQCLLRIALTIRAGSSGPRWWPWVRCVDAETRSASGGCAASGDER